MKLWLKLALVLVVAALLPLALAAVTIVEGDSQRLAESARAYHLATGELVLSEVRGLVARSVSELRAIGHTLGRVDEPIERREAAARAQLLGSELVDRVAIYDSAGERLVVMRARADAQAASSWTAPDRLDALSRREPERGYAAWSVVERSDGSLAVPILVAAHSPDGKIYAWLVADIELAPLNDFVAQLSERHFGGAGRVRILDEQLRVIVAENLTHVGHSIAGTPPVAGLQSGAVFRNDAAQTIDFVTPEGAERVGAIVPLPELGWAALVEQDRAVAYAAIDATWRTAALIGGGFAAFAILFGLLSGLRLAKPVEAIASASEKVAAGDFAVRVPTKRNDEIGRTAHAFNRMAEDLGSYRDRLVDQTRARENLSRFLSPEVVERIVGGREAIALGGERREITVLFADVVAFTKLADEREPELAVAVLNELFTIITEIVFQHGGIIDKFVGDCAMAIWGAPETRPDDARNAVRAAEAILRWLEVGNAKWKKQLGRDIELAIGIHTGTAVVGNIGSEKRMDYTAIGDAVNVAARLERLARPGQVLMTRETMQRVADEFSSKSIGTFDVVGRSRPSELFVLSD